MPALEELNDCSDQIAGCLRFSASPGAKGFEDVAMAIWRDNYLKAFSLSMFMEFSSLLSYLAPKSWSKPYADYIQSCNPGSAKETARTNCGPRLIKYQMQLLLICITVFQSGSRPFLHALLAPDPPQRKLFWRNVFFCGRAVKTCLVELFTEIAEEGATDCMICRCIIGARWVSIGEHAWSRRLTWVVSRCIDAMSLDITSNMTPVHSFSSRCTA